MSKEISEEHILFRITADKKGSIFWRADFVDDHNGDTAEDRGIPLTQRRQPLEVEEDPTISAFERSWRTLTFLAEEWGWMNGSVRMISKKRHTPVVIAWDIQSSAWEARAGLRHNDPSDDQLQVHPVGTVTVNGRTYPVYKDTVENSIYSGPLQELPMFEASFLRSDGKK